LFFLFLNFDLLGIFFGRKIAKFEAGNLSFGGNFGVKIELFLWPKFAFFLSDNCNSLPLLYYDAAVEFYLLAYHDSIIADTKHTTLVKKMFK